MKKEIGNRIDRYRTLWAQMKDYRSVVSTEVEGKAFIARHHLFLRSEEFKKSWHSDYNDEIFDSVFDCLACYRWYIIPDRLREATGLREETDLELLLDGAGYSTSLIAEELFSMIDDCLESGSCSETQLKSIRLAYNGLSGFQDIFKCRIVQWGFVKNHEKPYTQKDIDDVSIKSMSFVRNPNCQGIYSA